MLKKKTAIFIAILLISLSIVLIIVAVILNAFNSFFATNDSSVSTPDHNIIVNEVKKIKEKHCIDSFCIINMEIGYQRNADGGDITITYQNQGDVSIPAGFLNIEFKTKNEKKQLAFYYQQLEPGESANLLLSYLDEDIVSAVDYQLLQPTAEQIKEYEKTLYS